MKIDTDDVSATALLFAIFMSKLPKQHQERVALLLEDVIFPWYEAATGNYAESEKTMRTAVADKVEHELSSVDWVVRDGSISITDEYYDDEDSEEDEEFAEDSTLTVFNVVRVFSQSGAMGLHDLHVVVAPKEDLSITKDLTLMEFLATFRPVEGMTIKSFDA